MNQSMFSNNTTLQSLTDSDIEDFNREQLHALLPAIIYTAIMMVIGTPGNLIVLYVYFFKWRRSTSRMFILYLAALDLINCLTTLPMEIYIMRYSVMLDQPALCKLSRFSTYVMNSSSAFILLGIAVDRFKRICRPYQRTFSEQISKYISISAIITSVSLTWPSLVLYGTRKIPLAGGTVCLIENNFDRTPYPLVFFSCMALSTLFIFTLLSVLYYFVGLQIYKHRNFKLKNCSHVQKIMEDKSTVKSTSGKNSKDVVSKASNERVMNSIGRPVIEVQEPSSVPVENNVLMTTPYHLEIQAEPSHDVGTSCGLLDSSSNVGNELSSDRVLEQFSNKGVEVTSHIESIREGQNGQNASPRHHASPKRQKSKRKKRVRYLLVRGASTMNASYRGKCSNCLTVRIGRSTLMLFLITIAYIVSFLPFYTIAIIRQTDKDFVSNLSTAGYMAYQLFLRSYLLSSAINPIIYSFCNAQFRDFCIELLRHLILREPERNKSRLGRR